MYFAAQSIVVHSLCGLFYPGEECFKFSAAHAMEPLLLMLYCKATGFVPHREDLDEYDTFDDGVYCRSRSWLFLAYIVSFGAIMGSVAVLLQSYALNDAVDVVWPGVAGLFQVTLILAAGLLLFVSRTPADGSAPSSYGTF